MMPTESEFSEDVIAVQCWCTVSDVHRNRADLDQSQQAGDMLNAVLEEQRHIVVGTDPLATNRCAT